MRAQPTSQEDTSSLANPEVDLLLGAQIAVAWAGEAGEKGEQTRLGWWNTNLMFEYGGEDLFKRLLPQTWDWAVIQAVREAARRHDAAMRAKVHDPDSVVSLYRLGFTIDERVDERLMELERTGVAPSEALPRFSELMTEDWRQERFEEWVRSHGAAEFETAPAGRQLKGPPPASLEVTTKRLVAALDPLVERYPLPHFRRTH